MTLPVPAGAQLAVVSQKGRTLGFFDLATRRCTSQQKVIGEPHEVCFDPARRVVYVSHTYRSGYFLTATDKGSEITVVDVDTHSVVDIIDLAPEQAPHALQLDPSGTTLYVSVEAGPAGPGALLAVDLDSRRVTARVPAGAPIPHWAVLTPDGRKAYTTNKREPYVSVLDPRHGGPVRRVPVPSSEGLAVAPDGSRVFVATPLVIEPGRRDGRYAVHVIDVATDTTTAVIPVPEPPIPVHLTAGGRLLIGLWRTDGPPDERPRDGLLSILDGDSYEPCALVEVGPSPINIRSTPDGRLAFVSCLVSGTVAVIDLSTCLPAATLLVDPGDDADARRARNQGAHGLAYIPPASEPAEAGATGRMPRA